MNTFHVRPYSGKSLSQLKFISLDKGRLPLTRVPSMARKMIFHGTPSDLTRTWNQLKKVTADANVVNQYDSR